MSFSPRFSQGQLTCMAMSLWRLQEKGFSRKELTVILIAYFFGLAYFAEFLGLEGLFNWAVGWFEFLGGVV